MATGPFVITEQSLAMRLGVSREWLRDNRGEIGGLWSRAAHNQVCYSHAAYDALSALLEPRKDATAVETPALPENAASGQPAGTAERKNGPSAEVLTVHLCRFANRRVIHCHTVLGETVTLWVLDALKFAPGMRVLGLPRAGRPGVYDFAGNPENPGAGPRMPRRAGVW